MFVQNLFQESGLPNVRLDGEPQGPDVPRCNSETGAHQPNESDISGLPWTYLHTVNAENGISGLCYWPIICQYSSVFYITLHFDWTPCCKYIVFLYMVSKCNRHPGHFLVFVQLIFYLMK